MESATIKIRGARQNNLKDLDLDIPLNRFTVVTGVSGSGKSSLVLDTLYAEGQRRYVETFSPYARQFMDRMDRPRVERIEGIPPAIAIDRKEPVRTSRSSVGTMTEITDYVKLLFARRGTLHCRSCGRPVTPEGPQAVWRAVEKLAVGRRVVMTFPWSASGQEPGDPHAALLGAGYTRYWQKGAVRELEPSHTQKPGAPLDVLADRFISGRTDRKRVIDSADQAFRMGNGHLGLWVDTQPVLTFSRDLTCPDCRIAYTPARANLFSFNSPLGACDTCRGFGRTIAIDPELIVPDRTLSIAKGAIRPWGNADDHRDEYDDLTAFCRRHNISTRVPFKQIPARWQRAIFDGTPEFYGLKGFFDYLERKTYKMHVRVFLSRYRSYNKCQACGGTRFKPETLLYRIGDRTIAQIYALNVDHARAFMQTVEIPTGDNASRLVLEEIQGRLGYLKDVGLGYLTLDRQSRTLSGGEVQRVSLASALGASLVNTLYILDEPSIGLHPRDNHRLVSILKHLCRRPNTVVVVEHDPEIIRRSDYILDLGPAAGENGGEVTYFGPTAGCRHSLTGQYLRGQRRIRLSRQRRRPDDDRWLTVSGAAEHNLKHIDVRIPLGLLVCLSGVSGSGKSTLAVEVLYKGLKRLKNNSQGRPGAHAGIEGHPLIADVLLVDQRAIGRTPRANILTYTKAMDVLRRLLADTDAARRNGLTPGHFSFNTPGGRCESCKGQGFERVEMQFLSDIFVACAACGGRRYLPAVLEVEYRGKNMHDILGLTVKQALDLWKNVPPFTKALQPVQRAGLGYLRLGQPLSTLSGGEAQRLKLARYLTPAGNAPRLLIFDEPTTGLHMHDIARLLTAFGELTAAGHTVLVIEHNMDVVKNADWVIDLGPEGGDDGGHVVAAGTPDQVAACDRSHTGRFLVSYLDKRRRPASMAAPKNKCAVVTEPTPAAALKNTITINGAHEHNLKNISLAIPRDQLVVLSGVSGSGKSTLAFDLLFAEGQRRYLESLTPYVRQYMKVLERPAVDRVSGLPPTVAIEQRIAHSSRRSTVATLTEVYHFLRLLYSKVGQQHCPRCNVRLTTRSAPAIAASIRRRYGRESALILAPKVAGRKGFHKAPLARAHRLGYTQARIDGRIRTITKGMALSRHHEHTIEWVIGRLPAADLDSLVHTALEHGGGTLRVAGSGDEVFSLGGMCPTCNIGVSPLDPRLFSFNSHQGACSACDGLGRAPSIDGADLDCPQCGGSRLTPEALAVKIDGRSIHDMVRLPAQQLARSLTRISFDTRAAAVAKPIMAEIDSRLALLNTLELGYLSLDRSGDTLSGGEAQRVRLSAQLGSNLTGVLYILDEPTIGLHPRDNHLLLNTLKSLRDRGNTILVVEHDQETLRAADTLIDLGPGAGRHGGEVVAMGSVEAIRRTRRSVTGRWLDRPRTADVPHPRRSYRRRPALVVRGADKHNLKKLDVAFPLNTLCAVTGVSGSGKSTLVKETLYSGLKHRLAGNSNGYGACRKIEGWRQVDRVLEVDHHPIGRTPRSVPASYVGFLSEIRKLFAATPESRSRGYAPGRFSFNVKQGHCAACKGFGQPKVSMSFLPDVYVTCDACDGQRFNPDTLSVRFKGKTIAEVLSLTFHDALAFFAPVPRIKRPLKWVCDIGLGYLQLGQPSPTLSGGEAQRIKLAAQLARPGNGHTLYVLDEPTTGLHPSDVRRLLNVLQALVDQGNSVVIIEHNLQILQAVDYVIDLGPEGGSGGGHLVTRGSPREVARAHRKSHTGRFLHACFNGRPAS